MACLRGWTPKSNVMHHCKHAIASTHTRPIHITLDCCRRPWGPHAYITQCSCFHIYTKTATCHGGSLPPSLAAAIAQLCPSCRHNGMHTCRLLGAASYTTLYKQHWSMYNSDACCGKVWRPQALNPLQQPASPCIDTSACTPAVFSNTAAEPGKS